MHLEYLYICFVLFPFSITECWKKKFDKKQSGYLIVLQMEGKQFYYEKA